METAELARPPRDLVLLAGDLALDFANTVDRPHDQPAFDHLSDYAGLVAWSVLAGSMSTSDAAALRKRARRDSTAAAAAVQRAHQLRDAVSAVFTAAASDPANVDKRWAMLRPFVVDAVAHARLGPGDDGRRLFWPERDVAGSVLWPVAAAAGRLLVSAELAQVKRCAGCHWLFVDRSRNGRRRWCTMSDCGTQEKMRRYTARRAGRSL